LDIGTFHKMVLMPYFLNSLGQQNTTHLTSIISACFYTDALRLSTFMCRNSLFLSLCLSTCSYRCCCSSSFTLSRCSLRSLAASMASALLFENSASLIAFAFWKASLFILFSRFYCCYWVSLSCLLEEAYYRPIKVFLLTTKTLNSSSLPCGLLL
jgi:hypothetical protein